MGLFSVRLSEVFSIIGLKGCARAEIRLLCMKGRLHGSTSLMALSMLVALGTCLLPGCEEVQPALPAALANEERTSNEGRAEAAEITLAPSSPNAPPEAVRRDYDVSHFAEYQKPLLGTWMPKNMGCAGPANGSLYESEALVTITSEMLGQYENTSKALQVEQIPGKPASWKIASTFSPGTSEYEGSKALIFTLDAGTLFIDVDGHVTAYIKCKYNNK